MRVNSTILYDVWTQRYTVIVGNIIRYADTAFDANTLMNILIFGETLKRLLK